MHLKYQIVVITIACLIVGSSSLATDYEFTGSSYYFQDEVTVTSGDFLILKHNFTDLFIEDHILIVQFIISYNESVNIYWVSHLGYLEFVVNNQTQDISTININSSHNFTGIRNDWACMFNIKTFYMIIVNPTLFTEDYIIQFWAWFVYNKRSVSLSWYIVVALISINLVFISITIYLYRKKKFDSRRQKRI